MKLWGCDQLMPQIRGCVDQKPVFAIGADRDRSLGALKFRLSGSRAAAHPTSDIPLRYTTARRGAQDDDPKHDPSPGIKASKVDTGATTRVRPVGPPT